MTGKCIAKHVFNCMEMLNIRKVLSVFRCNSLDYRKLKDREEFYYCCSFLHENTRSFIKAVTLLLSSPWNSGVLWSLLLPRLLSISAGYWYVLRWLRRNCACIFFFHYLFFFVSSAFLILVLKFICLKFLHCAIVLNLPSFLSYASNHGKLEFHVSGYLIAVS